MRESDLRSESALLGLSGCEVSVLGNAGRWSALSSSKEALVDMVIMGWKSREEFGVMFA